MIDRSYFSIDYIPVMNGGCPTANVMAFCGKNLVMRDILGYVHGWMPIQEDNKLATECFRHLHDPSDSNSICVLEGKQEIEENEYTRFINYDFRLFVLEKKDGAQIGCALLHRYQDRLDIGCYIIPSERGKGYAIEVVKILGNSLPISTKRIEEMVDAWLKLDKHKHTL